MLLRTLNQTVPQIALAQLVWIRGAARLQSPVKFGANQCRIL